VEQGAGVLLQLGIEHERQYRGNEIDLLFHQHRFHAGKRPLDDRVVAVRLQAVLTQHGAHGDVDASAGRIDGNDLALEIFDFLDRTGGEDLVIVGNISGDAVLKVVGDDADVVHAGVHDRDRQSREREIADLELVVGDRRDHRRGSSVTHRLEYIGL